MFRNRNAARSALLDERARGMRASLTPSEALLWARIRGRRLGVVFRRQVPLLGRFSANFLAAAERLVIEVDGGCHAEQARADAQRDAVLVRARYRVLRLDAALVVRGIEAAVSLVRRRSSGEPVATSAQKRKPGFGCRVFSLSFVSLVGAGRLAAPRGGRRVAVGVLASLRAAARAGTLNAGRGPQAGRARRRVLRRYSPHVVS
ncbi:MAG TPA: DUF559 domain-containing protein [Polyangiaceae bacterium]|nr:DUF559 domain-containing protein [Polyangiaceae bacterium]